MSTLEKKKGYARLMFDFIASELGGAEFVRKFLALWKKDRDAQWPPKGGRKGAPAQQLQVALLNKEISRAEFSRRWEELWGPRSDANARFAAMIDRVSSACDVFREEPESDDELTEEQLRTFVKEALESYVLVIS